MKLVALAILAACGGPASTVTSGSAPSAPLPPLLHQVSAKPRGYANLSLAEGWLRRQLDLVTAELREIGPVLADCKVDVGKLERLRVALGEPLRIAAELDGPIDVKALTCVVGESVMTRLASLGLSIRDRRGGIAVDYDVEYADAPAAAAIAAKCTTASCFAFRFGPATRSIWVSASFARTMHVQLEGPGIGAAGAALAAALDKLRVTVPALASVKLDVRGDALGFDAANEPNEQLSQALRENLIEAFRIPSSSMMPTLHVGDHVFAVKGPLLGPPRPGDIFVYRTPEDRDNIFRYISGGPHTVTESEAGIAVDGKLLARETVESGVAYREPDFSTGDPLVQSGAIVREHIGARSYLTFRSGPPRQPGPWTVPEGMLFLLGDNRNNANDSRYNAPTPIDRLRGRAVAIWWASFNNVPDWDRIGTPIE